MINGDKIPQVTTLGRTILVKGELRAAEDVRVAGRIDGPVYCETGSVILEATCDVRGDIVANDITVFGRMTGKLVASDFVDLRSASAVSGQILSKRLIVDDGAQFQGRVEPQHLEAALRVARFQQKKAGA